MSLIRRRLPKDTYNRCITFLYGSIAEINRTLKRECPGRYRPLALSSLGFWQAYPHDGYEADYICVVRTGPKLEQLTTLMHEALHCASHTLRMAGLPHTAETEEAYTYYHAWIVAQCAGCMK